MPIRLAWQGNLTGFLQLGWAFLNFLESCNNISAQCHHFLGWLRSLCPHSGLASLRSLTALACLSS